MGKMDDDKFKMLLYINCLDPLPQLQSSDESQRLRVVWHTSKA